MDNLSYLELFMKPQKCAGFKLLQFLLAHMYKSKKKKSTFAIILAIAFSQHPHHILV